MPANVTLFLMLESLLVLVLLLFPFNADAREVVGSVKLEEGIKIADDDLFVVWSEGCKVGLPPEGKLELAQSKRGYVPRAAVAQKGQILVVKNSDDIRHNSFAHKAVPYDSGLQKPGTSYEVKLSTAGVEKIFCRIHPQMVAEVLILNNNCFSEMKGEKEISAFKLKAAAGKDKLWLWSPRLKSFQSRELAAGTSGKTEFALKQADFLTIAPPAPEPEKPGSDY